MADAPGAISAADALLEYEAYTGKLADRGNLSQICKSKLTELKLLIPSVRGREPGIVDKIATLLGAPWPIPVMDGFKRKKTTVKWTTVTDLAMTTMRDLEGCVFDDIWDKLPFDQCGLKHLQGARQRKPRKRGGSFVIDYLTKDDTADFGRFILAPLVRDKLTDDGQQIRKTNNQSGVTMSTDTAKAIARHVLPFYREHHYFSRACAWAFTAVTGKQTAGRANGRRRASCGALAGGDDLNQSSRDGAVVPHNKPAARRARRAPSAARFAKNGRGPHEFHRQVRTRQFPGDFVAVLDGAVKVGGRAVVQVVSPVGRRMAVYRDTGGPVDPGALANVLRGAAVRFGGRGRCPTCGSPLRPCHAGSVVFLGCSTYTPASGCMTKIYLVHDVHPRTSLSAASMASPRAPSRTVRSPSRAALRDSPRLWA